LARLVDRSAEWEVAWVLGAGSGETIGARLGSPPMAGQVAELASGSGRLVIGTVPAPHRAAFRHLVLGPTGAVRAAVQRLLAGGVAEGERADLRVARVLAGVPTLGAEIDDRTLPQEVGFDELGGISYSKGCYVGQETVARLHFRGHANWILRGLRVGPGRDPLPETVEVEGRTATRIGTVVALEDGTAVGLAKVRREFDPGTRLAVGDREIRVEALPLPVTTTGPAA
jgi:folate-binding protein YgfZ